MSMFARPSGTNQVLVPRPRNANKAFEHASPVKFRSSKTKTIFVLEKSHFLKIFYGWEDPAVSQGTVFRRRSHVWSSG